MALTMADWYIALFFQLIFIVAGWMVIRSAKKVDRKSQELRERGRRRDQARHDRLMAAIDGAEQLERAEAVIEFYRNEDAYSEISTDVAGNAFRRAHLHCGIMAQTYFDSKEPK